MAKRRMFSLDVVDTDKFLDMPATSQNLYFHLGMRADDEGFVSSPRKIASMVGCGIDDLKLLVTKNFLIPFENGVVVITDWKINNYIQKDRFNESKYYKEKDYLKLDANGSYVLGESSIDTECIQNVSMMDTQVRLGKDRLDNISSCEKDNELYLSIYEYWISKNIKKHIQLTTKMKKAIDKALKEYTKEDILEAINNYSVMYHDKDYEYCTYQWGLDEFLIKTDKDRIRQLPQFLNTGSKYLNYKKWKSKQKTSVDDGYSIF